MSHKGLEISFGVKVQILLILSIPWFVNNLMVWLYFAGRFLHNIIPKMKCKFKFLQK